MRACVTVSIHARDAPMMIFADIQITSIKFIIPIFLMSISNNQGQSSNCTMHVITKELSADYRQLSAGISIGLTDNR